MSMFCRECGAKLPEHTKVCPHCGKVFSQISERKTPAKPSSFHSAKDFDTTGWLLILGFFGIGGIHRLYVGKEVSGWIYFLTCGLFFVGTLYDLHLLLNNEFMDGYDYPVVAKKRSQKQRLKKHCKVIAAIYATLFVLMLIFDVIGLITLYSY